MAERVLFSLMFKDKTITNPVNKSEIITCSEIYHDYKRCRNQYHKGLRKKNECREIRTMAQTCYLNTEEDFEKHLISIFEEKIKYINYLKQEGSILYQYYKEDPTVFSIKKTEMDAGTNAFNELYTQANNKPNI